MRRTTHVPGPYRKLAEQSEAFRRPHDFQEQDLMCSVSPLCDWIRPDVAGLAAIGLLLGIAAFL